MGKNKQAQRTKNNARPSNSSRSAELLGTTLPNFVGFSALKDGGYVPILPGLSLCSINEVEMSHIDSNFQIALKKMNKKDATTKCKALREFSTLCKDSELSAVEGMLPFWPRLYCALAIDVEHRVREAAQMAHAAVVKRVGKGIAMYLKQLAGAWFTSQHDTYALAASAARNSFNHTFPQKKVIDAIVECQHEILTYICDNITIHTAQTLSLQKNLTAEEMEIKYQRVLIASLQGYNSYIKKVPTQEIVKMINMHKKIISNNKFWKLAKYDVLPVKTAFFNVLTSLIENADLLLKDEKKRAVTIVMNSLDEIEPALLSAVWESVLVTINKIEDWYCVVSIEKLVLPKLWRVLRSGGQSCASIVYPSLLPFVSPFPKLNVDVHNFYINFFSNMRQGFSVKSVQMSRVKMSAIITSYIECLRYFILLNVHDRELCISLLKEQLIPLLEMCLKEYSTMEYNLFREITQLVRYWSRNRHNEDYKSYSYLMQGFWSELTKLFSSLVDASETSETFNVPDTTGSEIDFLITLKTAPVHGRKNLKVKFCNPEENIQMQPQIQNMETDVDTEFHTELNNFVKFLCIKYFNKITEQRAKKYVTHLNKLIMSFESEDLFANSSDISKIQINFSNFCDILRNWLLEKSEETEDIVELIFSLMKHMNDSEKNKVLESLTQIEDIVITKNIIQCALFKNNINDMIVKKWYSKSKITSLLIAMTKEIASGNYSNLKENQRFILLALEISNDGDMLITEDGINEIVSILCNAFDSIDEMYMSHLAELISCIVLLTWSPKQPTHRAVRVLQTLFKLCSQDYFNDNCVALEMLRDVWKNGLLEAIKKLSHFEFIPLTRNISLIMWEKIYNSNEEQAQKTLLDMAADFLELILNNENHANEDYAKETVLTFLTGSAISTWMTEVTGIVLYGEVITGKLYVSNLDQKIQIYEEELSVNLTSNEVIDNTENCLKWALFNINVLLHLCLRMSNKNEEEESTSTDENVESNTEQLLIHDLNLPGITEVLINIVYSIILGKLYVNHYKSTKCYVDVNKILTIAENNFKQLQTYIDDVTYNEIFERIRMNRSKYGSMFCYIVHFCSELCNEAFNSDKMNEMCPKNDEVTLQELQILSKLQNFENTSVSREDDIYALIMARSVFVNQEDNSRYTDILEKIMLYAKENPKLLLLDHDISTISWEEFTLPLEVIRLLTDLVKKVPSKLVQEHWDFILISLLLWSFSVNKSKKETDNFKATSFTIAVCQLYCALQDLVNKHEEKEVSDVAQTLVDEWVNVFANHIQLEIIKMWTFYADSYNETTNALKPVILLDHLGKGIKMLNGNMLFNNESDTSTLSDNLDSTINLSLKLIRSPLVSVQLSAYHMLEHSLPQLIKQDKATEDLENFNINILNIKKMEDVLQNTQNIVNTILMDFKLCDTASCAIQPYTDSYTYTLGYLLTWAIIFDMCSKAHGDLLYQYAEILKDNFLPNLLNNIFRLMPEEVLQDNKNKSAKLLEIFRTEPSLDFGESWTESRLDHIVCWLYTNSLRRLPVLVRQWWSTADSRVSVAVDKITTNYVSGMLCQEVLNNKQPDIENMQVKVHLAFREVVAIYQMDDMKLKLTITLPRNHPLGAITVEPEQHVGGRANSRNCHMQLAIFFAHQNGSMWDGLALWKRNLDKKFAGVEECYICFSIFHASTYQIAKLSCQTCRKKFHTACLYKWFNTSQKFTCPVCRNVF